MSIKESVLVKRGTADVTGSGRAWFGPSGAADRLASMRWSPGTRPSRLASALIALVDVAAVAMTMAVLGSWSVLALIHAAACLVALTAAGSYRPRFSLGALDAAPRLAMVLAVPALALIAASAVVDQPQAIFAQAALVPLVIMAGRMMSYAAVRQCRRRGLLLEPVAVLGSGHVADTLMRRMREHPEYGLVPIGYVDSERNDDFEEPWLGAVGQLEEVVRRHALRRLVVAYSSTREHHLLGAVRTAVEHGVEIHVVPRFFDVSSAHGSQSIDEVWGIPVFALRLTGLRAQGAWRVKRYLDILVAGAALVVASPMLAACSVAVRLSSPGPVLFRQERLGQHGRCFEVLKFRSMRVNDVSDTAWSMTADPRQTAVGALLRRTNLDELPQLWNVLRGDMSLIGPRPERPHFVEIFADTVPGYAERHRAPVGMTGWAQIHGLRGDTSIDERALFDNRYIDHWSLWQDLVIAARTVAQVLAKGS